MSHIKVEPPPIPTVSTTSPSIPAPLELSVSSIPQYASLTPPQSATLQTPSSPRGRKLSHGKLYRDVSYEEDSVMSQTSSTSGYKECFTDRYSLLMLESPPQAALGLHMPPPLASPDIHDLPSTSSTSHDQTRHASLGQESSAESLNSGEDTALLPDTPTPQPPASPHHSSLGLFDHHQDEDTLL